MEDTFHCSSKGLVVGVDWFWVVRSTGWAEWLRRGEDDDQSANRPRESLHEASSHFITKS